MPLAHTSNFGSGTSYNDGRNNGIKVQENAELLSLPTGAPLFGLQDSNSGGPENIVGNPENGR